MKFSIIVPVYNVEKYLSQCIDSLLEQTFTSFEIILIDDGSTDKSPLICDEYAKKDNRIKIVHKENGGQSSARNVGTKLAEGEYIIYIDSDDFIMDSQFLMKIASAESGQDIIFYKHSKYLDSKKEYLNCTYTYAKLNMDGTYWDILKEMVKQDVFFGMPWNKCIRREVVVRNNILFKEGLTGEDMDWIYYIILNSQSIFVLDEVYIAYRQHSHSVTTSIGIKNMKDFLYILEKWYAEIQKETYSIEMKEVILASLAKYYSNFLIMYTRINEKEKHQHDNRIKDLAILLNYGFSRRPQMIKKIYSLAGFRITVKILSILDKIKN